MSSSCKKRVDQTYFVFYEKALKQFKLILRDNNIEDKELFLANTFSTLEKDGIHVCTHPGVSRIIEEFVNHANGSNLYCLLKSFSKNWEAVVVNKYANHVLEKCMWRSQQLFHALTNDMAEDTLSDSPELDSICTELVAYLWEHYPDFLQHSFASFTLRAFLPFMTGVIINRTPKRDSVVYPGHISLCRPADKEWQSHLTDLLNRFLLSKPSIRLIEDELASPFLQVLLVVASVRSEDLFRAVSKFVFRKSNLFVSHGDNGEDVKSEIPSVLSHPHSTYFIEQLVALLPPKNLTKFISRFLNSPDLVVTFALHPQANFVLQRVLDRTEVEAEASSLMASIEGRLGDLITSNRHGVVQSVAQLALRFDSLQARFNKHFLAALGCSDAGGKDGGSPEPRIALSISALKPWDSEVYALACKEETDVSVQKEDSDAGEESQKVDINNSESHQDNSNNSYSPTLQGCLMMQTLLGFQRTGLLTGSLLAFPTADLVQFSCHTNGSRVMQHLLRSEYVLPSRKKEIILKMSAQLGELACDQYGSHVMDVIWEVSPLEVREEVSKSLVASVHKLRNDKYGCFSFRKFAPAIYQRSRQQWLHVHEAFPPVIPELKKKKPALLNDKGFVARGKKRKRNTTKHADTT